MDRRTGFLTELKPSGQSRLVIMTHHAGLGFVGCKFDER